MDSEIRLPCGTVLKLLPHAAGGSHGIVVKEALVCSSEARRWAWVRDPLLGVLTARYSQRKGVEGSVCIAADGLLGNGRIVDLSVPGCLLETGLQLQANQPLRLRITYGTGKPLSVSLAVVRWVNGYRAGIEFIRMSEEDQVRLRWHV